MFVRFRLCTPTGVTAKGPTGDRPYKGLKRIHIILQETKGRGVMRQTLGSLRVLIR